MFEEKCDTHTDTNTKKILKIINSGEHKGSNPYLEMVHMIRKVLLLIFNWYISSGEHSLSDLVYVRRKCDFLKKYFKAKARVYHNVIGEDCYCLS